MGDSAAKTKRKQDFARIFLYGSGKIRYNRALTHIQEAEGMRFTKMHGIGNDYVYVNCFEEMVENPADFIEPFIKAG